MDGFTIGLSSPAQMTQPQNGYPYLLSDGYSRALAALAALAAGPAWADSRAEPALRLTGVVVTGPVREAIFAAPDGTILLVDEGGRLGPFTVCAIRRGEVELAGTDGSTVLSPSPDAVLRDDLRPPPVSVPLIDPVRREAGAENDR